MDILALSIVVPIPITILMIIRYKLMLQKSEPVKK